MSILWLIPIAAAIGIFVWYLMRKKAASQSHDHQIIPAVDIPDACYDSANYHATAGGVTVRAYCPVSDTALQLIENGIAHTIRNTADRNWTSFRNLSDFQVFLVPPATHNVETDPGSPALLVKTLDASGIQSTVQAAGTCIGVPGAMLRGDDTRYPSIILPFEESELPDHASYLEESARNEAEHIELWGNDKGLYFTYTGANDQHPIFPDIAGLNAVGLIGTRKRPHVTK